MVPAEYRRPADLPPGHVLVVGASATGIQLADEIQHAGRKVGRGPLGQHQIFPAAQTNAVAEPTVRSFVGAPGPRTARVRAAITDDDKSVVWLNVLTTVLAIPVSNGGATIEVLGVYKSDGTFMGWDAAGKPNGNKTPPK